jgi:thiamine-phosphate pyrophosphorylase
MNSPKIPESFGFYAILTEPLRGYDYCTRLFVDYKISFVQLRMKGAPKDAVMKTAQTMRKITAGTATRLIINDSPEVARDVWADGVHIGQNDVSYDEARRIVGADAVIGMSTHSVAQMREACAQGPGYVGAGPVWATPTKKVPDPVIGIDGMKAMLSEATVPVVAIGGITVDYLSAVLSAGARNFCMVRPITEAAEPEKVLKRILAVYKEYSPERGAI